MALSVERRTCDREAVSSTVRENKVAVHNVVFSFRRANVFAEAESVNVAMYVAQCTGVLMLCNRRITNY